MILGLLTFWRGMRSHPLLRVPEEPWPEEPECEAGEEECRYRKLFDILVRSFAYPKLRIFRFLSFHLNVYVFYFIFEEL